MQLNDNYGWVKVEKSRKYLIKVQIESKKDEGKATIENGR